MHAKPKENYQLWSSPLGQEEWRHRKLVLRLWLYGCQQEGPTRA